MIGVAAVVAICWKSSPGWLRALGGLVVIAAMIAPVLPFLALVPWHWIAKHRGLISRSRTPWSVTFAEGVVQLQSGTRAWSIPLERVQRARLARNDNWTESTMLEDALGLMGANGGELVRLPSSAKGFEQLLAALRARGVAVEEVLVSAPVVLD
ncbi:MAG: hypothetical protein JST54_23175 [Deltaproteobacteria bacterium]|nr:hypothetical protein [Deltaproteobacteria bacterium]